MRLYRSSITCIEVTNDQNDSVAKLEMFDAGAISITIDDLHNAATWKELANVIYDALKSMELEGDKP